MDVKSYDKPLTSFILTFAPTFSIFNVFNVNYNSCDYEK